MARQMKPKSGSERTSRERVIEGLAAAPGIAIGKAYVRAADDIDVPEYKIAKTKLAAELKRLERAVAVARRQIRTLQDRARNMPSESGDEMVFLFDAYLAMLDDSRLIRGAREAIESRQINAEAAVLDQFNELAERFQAMDDAYIAARLDDVREVAFRLIRSLHRGGSNHIPTAAKGSILIAEILSPADMAQVDPTRIVAVGAGLGGTEGHTAIMARALGLPAVLGAHDLVHGVDAGDDIIVDGFRGTVVVHPEPETIARYEKRRVAERRRARTLAKLRDQPAISRDGTDVRLMANVELPMEMELVANSGAEGIGLLRSEFQFMNRMDVPDEEEQVATLTEIADAMGDKPLTIRTLDVGGEKPAPALMQGLDEAAASELGLRGVRLSLANPEILRTQFRAILRVAAHHKVRILLPMVTTVSEVKKARKILSEEARKLAADGVDLPTPLPPMGVMIEVPGAALGADALAQASDFFAIGSNDLTMYTLAVDRANDHVAHLYDGLHPAVLRLIQFSTQAALRARIPVSICGEMAGDPRLTALLVGLGLRDLSMGALNIPLVKKRIRDMDTLAASQRALQIMEQSDAGRISMMVDDFNGLT